MNPLGYPLLEIIEIAFVGGFFWAFGGAAGGAFWHFVTRPFRK